MNWILRCRDCGWRFIIITDVGNEDEFCCPHCGGTNTGILKLTSGHHRVAALVKVLREMIGGGK